MKKDKQKPSHILPQGMEGEPIEEIRLEIGRTYKFTRVDGRKDCDPIIGTVIGGYWKYYVVKTKNYTTCISKYPEKIRIEEVSDKGIYSTT